VNDHLHPLFRKLLEPLMGKVIISAKPYGPGNPDYEYDKWQQEQVDDEAEAQRIANLKGELHVRVPKSKS